MKRDRICSILTALIAIAFATALRAQATQPAILDKSVRFVYLVSADRAERADYKAAIELAALSVQAWYKAQLGATFKLNPQIVEVAHSNQKAAWFYANANGENRDNWGYNNALAEGERLLGVKRNDPEHVWVIYADGPGNKGRGGSGVCIMPEDDLLGLIGQHPEQKEINRWIGGLGHEIGHAFGLPHPQDTEKDADAIMWAGFYHKYPVGCYLTAEDVEILNRSPFFFDEEGRSKADILEVLESFSYDEGTFSRTMNHTTGEIVWVEEKTDKSARYEFFEADYDEEDFYLQSVNRQLMIMIPYDGGDALLSTDKGVTWHFFKVVELAE